VSARPLSRPHYFHFSLPLAAAALSLAGCKVDDKEFQSRIFACDTSAADPLCGTDADGQPMQCFAARQIGATDFCTRHCGDVPMSLPDQDAVCVQGNALLKACNPEDDKNQTAHPNGACDHAELGCLRTDVLPHTDGTDEGVCITMRTCTENVDCRDPVRSVCAATFLRELYSQNTTLHADNLYCLQEGCDANETSCSPGETCLRKVIPAGANPPDICVPNCDSLGRCPPNHFCLRAISGPANPAVCIPGLLGFVCNTDVDCLLGTCADDGGTGAGHGDNLKLCTTQCNSDDDCNKFDSEQGLFLCNTAATPHPVCATPNAYRGASCDTDADCVRDKDSKCMRTAPTDRQGTCLHPCDANGGCLPRGGINQTCLPLLSADGPLPICLPGLFGYPCAADNNCVGGLSCRGPEPSQQICTGLCANDDDCAKDKWTLGGWCGAAIGAPVCIPPQDPGKPCTQDNQCASGVCGVDKTCAGSPT
jgi:hypothetical protein